MKNLNTIATALGKSEADLKQSFTSRSNILNRPHSPLTARTWHLSVRVSILPMGYFRSIRKAT
ncbi:hypothetical protein [Prevotella aurantiaca]|uniref:hypothetical protein n=1 Tax=Prevotella aurantiaca TaxID=596085 RepID=UPI0028DC4427|nr:hypothetical protein [Prevotella aurantiaca]